ncbi:MAG TPA: twin-arginine translocation signal domain-containing protein [Longimicrobiales bacterium]|nr:twin-arginine translocation signal domain-containing protein [Longimicrobiales bacterium]
MTPQSSAILSRRGFLRGAAGGGAAIALASFIPAGCARSYPQAARDHTELKALTPKEYAVARAAAEALLVGVPVSATTVAKRIDQELAWVGEPIRTDMKTVLNLTEHLTPLGGRMRRFTELEPEQRLAYLRTWRNSRLQLRRAAYQALKGFVYYFAYIDDATRPLTRFPGPWPERMKLPVKPVDFGDIV